MTSVDLNCDPPKKSVTTADDTWHPFPIEALPPVMERMAREVGRTLCVDSSLAALPMISIAGASIGNTARAKMSSDYAAPPNVWTAGITRSGERKSAVLRPIMQPIFDAQQQAAAEYAVKLAEFVKESEQRKAKLKDERGDSPIKPGYPHIYLGGDTTTEAIAVRLDEQRRGLINVFEELSALFSGMNQYRAGSGHDRETYLGLYDASAVKIDRKTSTPPVIYIPRAFVSITGMIQPGILANVLRPGEFDSGMAARFIFTAPPPKQATWVSDGIAHSVRDAWRDLLSSLLSLPLPEHPILIPPSDAAMSLWALTHDRMEVERFAESDDRMRAARAKLIGAVPRIALILQAVSAASGEQLASMKMIDELSMKRAVEIVEWATRETRRVYGLLGREGGEDDIVRRIDTNGGSVSVRELMQWSREFRGNRAIAESYLNSLQRDGIGRWEWEKQSKCGGKPRRVFTLHSRGDCNNNPAGATKNAGIVTVTGSSTDENVPHLEPEPLDGFVGEMSVKEAG